MRGGYMNQTEKHIMNFYKSINIIDPLLLSKELITEQLNIKLFYWKHSSAIVRRNDKYHLFINESLTMQRQWQEFGHEMYHYFYDETNYNVLRETYATYGESKADYFAYHFCVPTFMLMQFKGAEVYDVMDLFKVDYSFALRRLEMFRSKMIGRDEIGSHTRIGQKQKI